ncbi:MAG: glutamine synthetase family protein [Actinomycetota bacterium]
MLTREVMTRKELSSKIASGDIDTVIMAFVDRYGRLVGKRTTGPFFLDHVADHGTENCDYLLTCDLDNQPTPGFRFSSFETGYGDMVARADWDTIRVLPWVPGTALVMCDLFDRESGSLVDVAPRTILRRQVELAAELGYVPMLGSEIEFFLYRESYEAARAGGYRDLHTHSDWAQDYNILQTTRDEYVIGDVRRALQAAGVPVEFSKGEAGAGQHEINLSYAPAVEMADRNHIYKTATKEIAALHGRSATFMAKPSMSDVGSSCHVHVSLWSNGGSTPSFAGDGEPSAEFRHFLAGMVATAREFSLLWAPTVNSYRRFQPDSWAPTGIGWGVDNRTLGFRAVGHGASTRIESRIPGSDANSYLAFAGVIAGGLFGLREQLELGPAFEGNGYSDPSIPRIPWNLPDAIALWRNSEIARSAFGDDVHHWILRSAESEWEAFNRTVTDWERERYFERI